MKFFSCCITSAIVALTCIQETIAIESRKPLLVSAGKDGAPVYWQDEEWSKPEIDDKSSIKIHKREISYTSIDHSKRPVIGILTEPLRGDLYKPLDNYATADELIHAKDAQKVHYVPKAHVQYLEQAGLRVVAIDYRLSAEDRYALYDQLNGVYIPGDSHHTISDDIYKGAFVDTLHYQEQQMFDQKEHFPVFLLGNSLQTLTRAWSSHSGNLKKMKNMDQQVWPLRMVKQPHETFMFSEISRQEKQALFNVGQYFNKQSSGLTLHSLQNDERLRRSLLPIAVFHSHAGEANEDDFIAILEGKKVPLYAFAYSLELVQFYFEDPTQNNDENLLDHSLIARKHAQTVASLIADEARLSTHAFEHEAQIFENLIRHNKVSQIIYRRTGTDEDTMPVGMQAHDVYLL